MIAGVRRRSVALALVALASVAGCGIEPAPSAAPSATVVPLPTPVTTGYSIGVSGWYAGLVIHVDAATAVVDGGGGSVRVDLRLENQSADPASLEAPIVLVSGGSVVDPAEGTVIPDVPGASVASLSIRFALGEAFDLGHAALRVGRAGEHQVVVPLVDGSLPPVTLEPLIVPASGSATAGSLTISLAGVELRADLPDWDLELPSGTLVMTVTYSARYRGAFSGGFAFTGANIGLRLPDGTTVAARPDGHSQSIAVLLPGAATRGLMTRFDVPVPGPGTYGLVIRDGRSSNRIPFTIEAPSPSR